MRRSEPDQRCRATNPSRTAKPAARLLLAADRQDQAPVNRLRVHRMESVRLLPTAERPEPANMLLVDRTALAVVLLAEQDRRPVNSRQPLRTAPVLLWRTDNQDPAKILRVVRTNLVLLPVERRRINMPWVDRITSMLLLRTDRRDRGKVLRVLRTAPVQNR
jgi:hypothetical protein